MVRFRYVNKVTGEEREEDRRIADRDVMPEPAAEWERRMEAPNFTSVSYLDGQKRPAREGYDNIKAAAKLKVDRAETMDPKEKGRLDKEIHRLEKI